ncbi:phosphate propanoyltransferase [Metallumcola ferriviriculae]|uniref:Phosphate propanoyltransferase n=1 Tax=Metallumcola ferriviriculae TaxID=3039180 RepID=A0AAU0UQI4_9FIRM|nr:phosphate propanoyltransferase [Desulfitibacteraceae bacterium MK1]
MRTATVSIGVSNRHVHLSPKHLEMLFGKDYSLAEVKDLGQPGQFAAQETVSLVGPKGIVEGVRVLGPIRKSTQVEISRTDSFRLGIKAPVKESGDLAGTPGCMLVGPAGTVSLSEGVIIAVRHIHMSPKEAKQLGYKDCDRVSVLVEGERELCFHSVIVRVHPDFRLEMHIDTDEANASMLATGDQVKILGRTQDALDLVG